MTKRRPWWSDWQLRVAAFACGLLLLSSPGTLLAAEKSAHKSVPAKKKAVTNKVKKPQASPHSPLPAEIGTADIIESETTGLHGSASFYGQDFHGRRTATGETFDLRGFTAASNNFPLGSWVAVRRLDNNRCAIVNVNDRMHARHKRRIIDVSRGVAEYLDMIRAGVVLVRVAPLKGDSRNDSSCQASFEAGSAPSVATGAKTWREAPFPPQLDAMH